MADNKQEQKPQAPPQPQKASEIPSAVSAELDEIMRRLRQLEEHYSSLRKKSQIVEQNMLKDAKDAFEEIKLITQTIGELKSDISEINEKMLKMNDEIKSSVPKTEFNTISKYLDFWQPLDFLTREEAEKLLREFKQ